MRKNSFVTLLLFFFPALLVAQADKNFTDGEGLKQGLWEKYDDNGKLLYSGRFLNDAPVGIFTYYFPDGNIKALMTHSADSAGMAEVINFHPNGKKMAEGKYYHKKRHARWVFYDEEELLLSEEQYNHGQKTGLWVVYYPDGTINEQIRYQQNKKQGEWKQYFTDGALKVQGRFDNGLLEGRVDYFHPNGKIMVTGEYVKNLKEGTWRFFDEEGKLVKEQEYTAGRLLTDPLKN
ncbi:MAG: toxin-antitoxin system YwqK family antitoxin [Bacteroidales bacterium]|nr:toxin-antitoxin system YwqK family antitoxin [Bacteroidales bacterium]NCC74619.1 toxin-antitoxin system YwqK family antitoxin [Sphingobacteriia bacterium]MDD2322542.1 toxin-antitoxin system YwqK family antitoxin [Bacteroidales bacterium]MDD3009824.1 toxin-antitoxin system YwqK family antitoxin [Bacteroidales bacterium]MDD3961373.1 toxin-antitoxin system YwqK family antitoxin [Bacteroidales bacterium]